MKNDSHLNHLAQNWLPVPSGQKPLGTHHLFRREFSIQDPAEETVLHITAASVYRVYVNGKRIMMGPARGTVHYAFVDAVDLSPKLREGNNLLAVEVCYYPDNTPAVLQHEFPPVDPGLTLSVTVGDSMLFGLDGQWRMTDVDAYETDTSWARGQLSEHLHAGGYPTGWMTPPFDDKAWKELNVDHVLPAPFELRPRPTPLPVIHVRPPARIVDVGCLSFPETYLTEPIPAGKLAWFGKQGDWQGDMSVEERVRTPRELDHLQYRRVCTAVTGGGLADSPEQLLEDGQGALTLRGTATSGGYAVYDLGDMIAGVGSVDVTLPEGARLDIALMDWLAPDSGAPDDGWERLCSAMVGYGVITLIGNGERIRFTGMQIHTFRFICLAARDLKEGESIQVHAVGGEHLCAIRESDCSAEVLCSDPVLNRIVEATKRTTRLMAQDFCASGGTAERIITAGDCLQVSEAGRLFFGEVGRMLSSATFDLFLDQKVGDGGNWPNLPRGRAGGVTRGQSENMNWMLAPCMMIFDMMGLARERHEALPEKHVRAALGMAEDAKANLTPEGLIHSDQTMSNWSDWSKMGVGDRSRAYQGVCTSTNGYYYRMFAELAELHPGEDIFAELADTMRAGLRSLCAPCLANTAQRVSRFVPDLYLRQDDGTLKAFEAKEANVFGGGTVIVSEVTQYWLLWSGALTSEQEGRLWDVLREWRSFEIPRRDNTRTINPSRASSVLGLYPRFHYLHRQHDPKLYQDARDAFGMNVLWDNTLWESLELDSRSTLHPAPAYAGILLYRALTGLSQGAAADEVLVAPLVDDSVEWARGTLKTEKGLVGVSWQQQASLFVMKVALPEGMKAKVRLPGSVLGKVVAGGHAIPDGGSCDINQSTSFTLSNANGITQETL